MNEPTSSTPDPRPDVLIAVDGEFKGRRAIVKDACTPGLLLVYIFARTPAKDEERGLSREERKRRFGSFDEWDAAENWKPKQTALRFLDATHEAAACGVELPPLPSFPPIPLFERVLRARNALGPRKSVSRRERFVDLDTPS